MQPAILTPDTELLDAHAAAFYRRALQLLTAANIPFLLGGAYALTFHTGIVRHTKDLDLFLRRSDLDAVRAVLEPQGYRTEVIYPHWLAKVFADGWFVDLIFNLGNGTGPVDDGWLTRGVPGEALGQPVRIISPEDMIWSKAIVMDRGRFDGADIAHLLRACGKTLRWRLLLDLAGRHWRILLSHLILFGYVYPSERAGVPDEVLRQLSNRLLAETGASAPAEPVCQGTLLSPTQYLVDVEQWGYQDARLPPWGVMTPEEVRQWTEGVQAGR
jgi:putative nucleotidyltransferase-like protein